MNLTTVTYPMHGVLRSEAVIEWIDDVRESLDAAFEAIAEGKAQ